MSFTMSLPFTQSFIKSGWPYTLCFSFHDSTHFLKKIDALFHISFLCQFTILVPRHVHMCILLDRYIFVCADPVSISYIYLRVRWSRFHS